MPSDSRRAGFSRERTRGTGTPSAGEFALAEAHAHLARSRTTEDPSAMPAEDDALYRRWFPLADTDNDGRVTGQDAVAFFQLSGLPKDALARAWQLADINRQGFLGPDQFVRALRVIALAQSGVAVSDINSALLDAKVEEGSLGLATLEGIDQSAGAHNNPFETFALRDDLPKSKSKSKINAKQATSIIDSLKEIYKSKVRPVEEALKFGSFYSPLLTDGDFEGKPSVLLLGQYSTGKTTFIKHLLGTEYPGCNIGPEPTTDRFVVVMHGHEPRTTPGQTLAVQSDKPFTGLSAFGSSFLSKFEASQCDAKLLEEVTIVDTPGVLSGEKQRIDRGYSFVQVCEWFAARSDVILLLFDPHKLDISDEFKTVISSLRGHDDKVRVVLNKADQVSAQQLLRVYGALMWSLGKVFMTPEVCKVYVGSFNTEPPRTDDNQLGAELFAREQADLKKDLLDIPQKSCDRKVNEFVKRVRACLTHAKIVSHFRKQMPVMTGHADRQKKLMANIEREFETCMHEHQIPRGDMPHPRRFREIMQGMQIWKWPKLDKKQLQKLEEVLTVDVPEVMKSFDNPF